jgi:transcriptional regulator of arginine metabolism
MKNERQKKIRELIETYNIDTQEALILKLKEAGFTVTQTTISRDINQLKLVKAVTADGGYKYIVPDVKRENNRPVMNSVIVDAVISVEAARNIVVVKTHPGMASAIGASVDELLKDKFIGSIAGDDVLLVIAKGIDEANALETEMKKNVRFCWMI